MAEKGVTEFPRKYYKHSSSCSTNGVTLILKWTVKNFSESVKGKVYLFPPVRPSSKCDLKVSFHKTDSGNICLFIQNKIEYVLNLKATTTIYDTCRKELYREVIEDLTLKEETDILLKLRNVKHLPEPLPNDSLLFDIKLDIFDLKCKYFEETAYERDTEINLSEDMKNWILAEHPEEIFLKTKDCQIPANKAILCARSPVFRKMFDHPTSEQEKNIVDIDDVNGTTMKVLVDFLYSGKSDFPKTELQSLKELYYAADKYDVQDLRKVCAQNMIPLLTVDNALGILAMAHQHSDEYFKNKCMVYISSCLQEVMQTESWVHLKASDLALAVEVLETCFKVSAAALIYLQE